MILYYDGHCALCHSAVKFVLLHDVRQSFQFAPLKGELARTRLPASLPNTMVVETAERSLLTHSSAWIYILERLDGRWKLAARALSIIPRPVRDAGYRIVASSRRILGRPELTCPVLPSELRSRFLP